MDAEDDIVGNDLFFSEEKLLRLGKNINRIPSRRQQLDEYAFPEDNYLKLDLETWKKYPDYRLVLPTPEFNRFGMTLAPTPKTKGTFKGKRFFREVRPNPYLFEVNHPEVLIEMLLPDDMAYIKIKEAWVCWEKKKPLFNWYYKGKPGRKVRSADRDLEHGQLVAARKPNGNIFRARFFKENLNYPILLGLDSGLEYKAHKVQIFAIEEQFLEDTCSVIRCVITNIKNVLTEEHIKAYWPLFLGTETLNIFWNTFLERSVKYGGFILTKGELSLEDPYTYNVELCPDFEKQEVRDFFEDLLLETVSSELNSIPTKDNSVYICNMSEKGGVWLCRDFGLFNALNNYLLEKNSREDLRNGLLKAVAELEFKSALQWFNEVVYTWGKLFLVHPRNTSTFQRAKVINIFTDPECYKVQFIDTGGTRFIYFKDELWSIFPDRQFPNYINKLPPLCKKFHVDGVHLIHEPWLKSREFSGVKMQVRIINEKREEYDESLNAITKAVTVVPSIKIETVPSHGPRIDVNAILLQQQRQCGGKPRRRQQQERRPPRRTFGN